ncbi:MAG: hypothetical protein PHU95_03520 [Candidatus Thermoplasmatota archaeon]|nr:hypothetical protein [Candidatus Thermoplasmatota archaeon]
MPTVESTYTVATTAPGREDYSASVEISPIPVIRGYQEAAYFDHFFEDVGAGATAEYEADEFDYAHFIFNTVVSVSAYTYFRCRVYSYNEETDTWVLIRNITGYQKKLATTSHGYPVSKMKIRFTNYGDVPVNAYYSHVGLKGMEKIYPALIHGELP